MVKCQRKFLVKVVFLARLLQPQVVPLPGSRRRSRHRFIAERAGIRRPSAKTARHDIGDHVANILLRAGLLAALYDSGRPQRPAAFPGPKLLEKTRRKIDILMRVEHGREGTELACMEVMIDLHASRYR